MRFLKSASETILNSRFQTLRPFPARPLIQPCTLCTVQLQGLHHIDGDVNGDLDVVQCPACTAVRSRHATLYVWRIGRQLV